MAQRVSSKTRHALGTPWQKCLLIFEWTAFQCLSIHFGMSAKFIRQTILRWPDLPALVIKWEMILWQ
eukprot:5317106-Amphidinium_carterae.1